jgi:hypothetical protein
VKAIIRATRKSSRSKVPSEATPEKRIADVTKIVGEGANEQSIESAVWAFSNQVRATALRRKQREPIRTRPQTKREKQAVSRVAKTLRALNAQLRDPE